MSLIHTSNTCAKVLLIFRAFFYATLLSPCILRTYCVTLLIYFDSTVGSNYVHLYTSLFSYSITKICNR